MQLFCFCLLLGLFTNAANSNLSKAFQNEDLSAICESFNVSSLINDRVFPVNSTQIKSCKKCDVARLSSLWLPNVLEAKLEERQLNVVIMYYNLYKLQSWLAGQIRYNGCLAPGKTISKKNCKLRCCEVKSAVGEINNVFTRFPYSNAKSQFKKMKRKAMKAFKKDRETRRMLKKSFRNKDFKLAKKLAKKTSSCLLHAEFVADKATAFCDE